MQRQQGLSDYIGSAEHKLTQLTARVEQLEETVYRKRKRKSATEAQRFLLLYYAGAVDHIREMPISQNSKDLYVATAADIDPENARKFLSELGKKEKPLLETASNYSFLVDFFEKVKDRKREAEVAKILNKIRTVKEKENL